MSPIQKERCRRIALRRGFDERQQSLVNSCETLIDAAVSDDWNSFVTALVNAAIMLEQVRVLLPGEWQEIFEARQNALISSQFYSGGGRDAFM